MNDDDNSQTLNDASGSSASPHDSRLCEARLNPFSAPLSATENVLSQSVFKPPEINFMLVVEVTVDSRAGPVSAVGGAEGCRAAEE